MIKVIFCDIDGVLNLSRNKEYLISKNNNKEEWMFNNIYDPESILNLRKIILETKARIVSSSNRNCDSQCHDAFISNMNLYEIDNYFYDAVCIDSKDKNIEINKFLDRNHTIIGKYIILDDFTPQFTDENLIKNLYYINPNLGITEQDVKNIVEILT